MSTKKIRRIGAVVLSIFVAGGGLASAEYRAESDTGAGRLDIIENMRRIARENEPTEKQKKMIDEMRDMYGKLNKPYNPQNPAEGDPVPTAFEGDDLTYDQVTGEFVAKGKVHIVQLDGHSFDAPGEDGEITGNTRRQEINIEGEAEVLQYPVKTEGTPVSKVTVNGYRTHYNYGTGMGTMANAKGKVDHQYITGKRFEFYPNRVVIYDGTTTRCSAKKPDYHESAKKIVIWPNDRMYLYNVKVWVGNVMLYKKKYMEKDISPQAENPEYPRVGYSKNDGFWIKQNFKTPVAPYTNIYSDFYANTKDGIRSHSELVWGVPHYSAKVAYGYYEDGDDNWIKKKPSFITQYDNHMGGLPLSYVISYETGHWQRVRTSDNISSTHTEYFFGVAHDMIVLPANYFLFLGTGYRITKETYDDSTNKGWTFGGTLMKLFDDRWAGYLAYEYNHVNAENSLFDYNAADYSQSGEAGLSYRLTKNDRFVAGIGYDLKTKHLRDVDYYWFHDLHCSQLILRYRPKRHQWHVDWQFLPW